MAKLQHSSIIPVKRDELFHFLAEPKNMAGIAPENLQIEEVSGDTRLAIGREVKYRVLRMGVVASWVLRLEEYEEGTLLVESQKVGIFSSWQWSQRLEDHGVNEHGEPQTLLTDSIEYHLPLGLLGCLVDDFFIRQDTQKLLESRHEKLRGHFGLLRTEAK